MRAYDAICNTFWAMPEADLRRMLQIAAREHTVDAGVAALIDRRKETLAQREQGRLEGTQSVLLREGVAILPIEGPIFPRANMITEFSGGTTLTTLARDFQLALEAPSVRSILFAIDSPGGAVSGIADMAALIYAARDQKPITAYVSGYGCSAAYELATAAGELILAPTAMIGSIGVRTVYVDTTEAERQLGVQTVHIVSDQSPDKVLNGATDDGYAKLKATCTAICTEFVASVARYRGVSEATVLADFGRGDVLVGRAAVAAGMADRLGTFEETLALLAEGRSDGNIRFAAGDARTGKETDLMADDKGRAEGKDTSWVAGLKEFLGLGGSTQPAPATSPAGAASDDTQAVAEPVAATAPEPVAVIPPPAPTPPADPTDWRAQAEQAQQQAAQEREARFLADARLFAAEEIGAHRALPGEREALQGRYLRAALDDAQHPLQGESRVEGLKAQQAARVPHQLTAETVPVGQPEGGAVYAVAAQTETTGAAGKPPTPERVNSLVTLTPLGAAVARNGKGN